MPVAGPRVASVLAPDRRARAALPVMTAPVTQPTPPLMDTLKKRSEFLAVAKGGRIGRRAFVLQGLKRTDELPPRIGYTVTKKTGSSPVRSRIKRRLRAAVAALHADDIPTKADFVLVGRENALDLPFQVLVSDLKSSLRLALDPESARRRGKPRKTKANSDHEAKPRRKQG